MTIPVAPSPASAQSLTQEPPVGFSEAPAAGHDFASLMHRAVKRDPQENPASNPEAGRPRSPQRAVNPPGRPAHSKAGHALAKGRRGATAKSEETDADPSTTADPQALLPQVAPEAAPAQPQPDATAAPTTEPTDATTSDEKAEAPADATQVAGSLLPQPLLCLLNVASVLVQQPVPTGTGATRAPATPGSAQAGASNPVGLLTAAPVLSTAPASTPAPAPAADASPSPQPPVTPPAANDPAEPPVLPTDPAPKAADTAADSSQATPTPTTSREGPPASPPAHLHHPPPVSPPATSDPPPEAASPDPAISAELIAHLPGTAPQIVIKSQGPAEHRLTDDTMSAASRSGEGGMSLALEPNTMPVTRETNETANGAGQNLPTVEVVAEVAHSVGRDRKEATPAAERALSVSGTFPEHAASVAAHGANAEPTAHGTEALPSTSPLEAVHRAIETTTLGLERMQNSSVSLVLNPDANTQLSLHVKWQQGHFEALAVLERGDFSALGAHWSQLQNRLAEQGIRLAPLVSTSNPSMSFTQNQFSAPRQQQEPVQAFELPGRNLPKSKALNSTARPVAAGSAREWWA